MTARTWYLARPPLVRVLVIIAVIVAVYYLVALTFAAIPLLFAIALAPRVLHRGRRRGHNLAADLIAGGAGYLLGSLRRSRGESRRRSGPTIKVRGETYASPAAARRASRELFAQASNVPNETGQWRSLIDHAIELERAAWEAEA